MLNESNIRGISMRDLVMYTDMGSLLNVIYEGGRLFFIKQTILDFIYNTFWVEDEKEQKYARMNAVLLFPKHGSLMNTWLCEQGFLVRTGYEDVEKWAQRVLEINHFDEERDWLMGDVLPEEEWNGRRVDERSARENFVKYLQHKSSAIVSDPLPKVVVRMADEALVSMFHRTLALRECFPHSSDAVSHLAACCAMAAVTDVHDDQDFYGVKLDYRKSLLAFAESRFGDIGDLDDHGLSHHLVDDMSYMMDILTEYGKTDESAMLNDIIARYTEGDFCTIAKLVQAANRFKGSAFLDGLHGSLHREICNILDVSDAIKLPETETDDAFPFEPEGPSIEHKMSWVFDNETSLFNETSQSAKILKTVCAFMNNLHEDGGGHVYIGTDEKRRTVSGIQNDIDVLVTKGELDPDKDLPDEYLRHIQDIIKRKFTETYDKVKPSLICDSRVVDLYVQPADVGVVYFNGIAYERYGATSRVMRDDKRESIISRKYLAKIDLADKIEVVRKAIHLGQTVILHGYDSSNSNTEEDRKVEVFAFTNEKRRDGIWAYDAKARKNKVFLLKRAESIEVFDEKWKNEKAHQKAELDVSGFYGNERIPLKMELRSVRAKNLFLEHYPDADQAMVQTPSKHVWTIDTKLLSTTSLNAAASFYLAYSDDVDIKGTPALVKIVTEKINGLLEKL